MKNKQQDKQPTEMFESMNFIHVNQHNIKANMKNETDIPVLTCKSKHGTRPTHEAIVYGADGKPAGVFRTDGNPKSCGARVWFEPFYGVGVVDRGTE